MRILVISNLYPPETIGGYEIQCAQAVAELRSRGHDVMVLTSVPRRPVGTHDRGIQRVLRTPDVYANERVGIRSPFWEFESNLLNVENIYLLLDALETWAPDVCYLWNLVAIGGAGIVTALDYLDVPWVWHLGDAVPSMLCNFDGALQAMGRQMGLQFSGRFLACSRTVVDRVERLVPIQGRTRVVPNWVRRSTPPADRDYFEGGRPLRLVYAGRLAEEKGIFLILEVLARLIDTGHSQIALDMIGTGLEDDVRSRMSDLGVEQHVTLRGWIPQAEVARHMSQSDVFIFPAHIEDSMPLGPLEAASVGCVPLITWASGISEWLVDGIHCLKADRAPEAFAEVLRKVIDGEVDLRTMSRQAAQIVDDQFTIDTIMPVVESELILATEGRQIQHGKAPQLYRMALICDALLRRYVLDKWNQDGPGRPEAEEVV